MELGGVKCSLCKDEIDLLKSEIYNLKIKQSKFDEICNLNKIKIGKINDLEKTIKEKNDKYSILLSRNIDELDYYIDIAIGLLNKKKIDIPTVLNIEGNLIKQKRNYLEKLLFEIYKHI